MCQQGSAKRDRGGKVMAWDFCQMAHQYDSLEKALKANPSPDIEIPSMRFSSDVEIPAILYNIAGAWPLHSWRYLLGIVLLIY